jgi:uncharacterized membrane protein
MRRFSLDDLVSRFRRPKPLVESPLAFTAGLGLGATLMYALDPDRGRRRRALARDKVERLRHAARVGLIRTQRDVYFRARGIAHRVRSRFGGSEPIDDELIAEHIRADLGHRVSHFRSLEIAVRDGAVTLSGPIRRTEVGDLLRGVRRIRGVRGIVDRLEVHDEDDRVPALQGDAKRPNARWDVLQDHWAPSTRLFATIAGAVFGISGIRRRGLTGAVFGAIGTVLALRAFSNLPMRRLFGVGAGYRAIDLQRTITVRAPVDEVFRFWKRFENFPRFMEHVELVEVENEGKRSHWRVAGPARTTVEFEAEITRLVPNRVIAWRTLPGSLVEHSGVVHFEEAPGRATRLDIHMSYNPPAGSLGHVVAKLFHKDPAAAMSDDLVRMKSLLEDGKASAHGERVTLEQLLH